MKVITTMNMHTPIMSITRETPAAVASRGR
jgi:hypothetical protein